MCMDEEGGPSLLEGHPSCRSSCLRFKELQMISLDSIFDIPAPHVSKNLFVEETNKSSACHVCPSDRFADFPQESQHPTCLRAPSTITQEYAERPFQTPPHRLLRKLNLIPFEEISSIRSNLFNAKNSSQHQPTFYQSKCPSSQDWFPSGPKCWTFTFFSKQSSSSTSMLIWTLLLLSVLLPAAPQVRGTTASCFNSDEPPAPKKYIFDKKNQVLLPLTLATSDRISHRLATAIFRIFLSEKVGYQNVTVVRYNSSWSSGSDNSHQDNVGGMIDLEVWRSPNHDTTGTVNCGSQGSGGRFGWYVTNTSTAHQRGAITDHWRAFKSPSVASIFALSEEEDKDLRRRYTNINGRYFCNHLNCSEGVFTPPQCQDNPSCATIFVGDFASSSFLMEQIVWQKLLVRVMWIGPNLNPAFIENFRPPGKELMFFSWWPNAISTLPNILPVSFPPCTTIDNPLLSENFTCRYELHALEKHVWEHLKEKAMTLFQAVERFHLSGANYRYLLDVYRKETRAIFTEQPVQTLTDSDDDRIIERIACAWLNNRTHAGILKNWTPMFSHDKPALWVAGIFPVKEGRYISPELMLAASMAERRIKADPKVLNDFELRLLMQNGKCNRDAVLSAFITYIGKGSQDYSLDFNQMVGILGPSCSETVEPLAGVAQAYYTVIISYSAEGAIFNDEVKYPYFFRTIPENLMFKHVYQNLLTHFKWKRVASLSQSGNKYSEYLTSLLDTLQPHNVQLDNHKFSGEATDMSKYLLRLKNQNYRIIIGDFYDSIAWEVMCEAYHQNMTARHGYVWFIPHWLSPNWWKPKEHKQASEQPLMVAGPAGVNASSPPSKCDSSHILKALDGHLSLGYTYFAPDNSTFHENITVAEWKEEYNKLFPTSYIPDYAGYTYDAMWTYAFALDKLLKEDLTHYADLHSEDTNRRFVEILKETNFSGVSGQIDFSPKVKKKSIVNVYQFRTDTNHEPQYFKVGYFESERDNELGGKLYLNTPIDIKWLTESGTVPLDGSITCSLYFITEFMHVSCEAAIMLLMFFLFFVFTLILLVACLMYKRRYDKMRPPILWPRMEECEVPRSKIVMNRTIGQGQFGTVYGGEVEGKDGVWVAAAIKTLKVGSTDEDKLDFLQEAKMMKSLDHPNIIKLLALCLVKEPILMVMEFMLHGDLKVYLLARRHLVADRNPHDDEDEMSNKRLTGMALDVACALAYLSEKKYVHRDVACRNCLVNVDLVVKLGDFGMAREVFNSNYYRFSRKGMLPVRWMAPESLEDGIFTTASDMWSYGVLLYEIITFANFPFHDLSSNQVVEQVKRGNTIPIPPDVKPQIRQLLLRCWRMNPSQRPTFPEMMEHLTNNPRLLMPCLDMPSASVEINDENSGPHFRKMSGPNRNQTAGNRQRNTSPVDSLPSPGGLYNTSPNSGEFDPVILKASQHQYRPAPLENGNGPVMEPLLSKDSYVTRYALIQRTRSPDAASMERSPSGLTVV